MDYKQLIRDAQKVKSCLSELKDSRVVALKEVKIYIPVRFEERGLAEIGIDTYISGIYAMVVEDKYYGVSLVNAMIRIEPTSIMKIKIDGVEYYEFIFRPGSTVFSSVNLIKKDTLVYNIYDEIISKGRVPWYLGYVELGKIFDTALYHADANVGTDVEVTELIISIVARDRKDKTKYYRSVIKDFSDLKTNPPTFIPLRSVIYAASNTTNKIGGSYQSVGIVSALVNPATRQERIEGLLMD